LSAWLLESYCNCLIVNGLLHIEYDVLLQSDWQPDLTSVSTSEQANNDDDYTANGANTEVKKYHIHIVLCVGGSKRKVCCIDHKVVINCITVLYEQNSTVMRLIGHIQHFYALN